MNGFFAGESVPVNEKLSSDENAQVRMPDVQVNVQVDRTEEMSVAEKGNDNQQLQVQTETLAVARPESL